MLYRFYYSIQLAFWFPRDQYGQPENICIDSVPVTKSISAGPSLKSFYMVWRSAQMSFCVQVFHCCGVKQPGAGGVVWMNSKPLFVRPSKSDCTLIAFKFNDHKITPKTTLIKQSCLFTVIFSVFFVLLNLNITKVLCYRWKPLQSSTK